MREMIYSECNSFDVVSVWMIMVLYRKIVY